MYIIYNFVFYECLLRAAVYILDMWGEIYVCVLRSWCFDACQLVIVLLAKCQEYMLCAFMYLQYLIGANSWITMLRASNIMYTFM